MRVLPLHGTPIKPFPELPVYEHEIGNSSCSARLQAGICAIPKCPPEGRRYKGLSRVRLLTDRVNALNI